MSCWNHPTVTVFGSVAPCQEGNTPGSLCFDGEDGYVHDIDGGKTCRPDGFTGPVSCGGSQKPIPKNVRDCTPPPPTPPQFKPANGPGFITNARPEDQTCDLLCVGDALDLGATYVGLGGLLGCELACEIIAGALTLGSTLAYTFADSTE